MNNGLLDVIDGNVGSLASNCGKHIRVQNLKFQTKLEDHHKD